MTTPNSANYWNSNIEAQDAQQKKYRSIPVPATLANNQKNIGETQRLELLTEFLANKDNFGERFPHLAHLPLEDQLFELQNYIDKVKDAPENQQADAQRSLGGHLEDFGNVIKGGLLKGVGAVLGAPGVSQTVEAISAPGEEAAAQLIYNFARVIPGEQDIERGVNKWRAENPDAPWWKRHTLTSAVRQEGFGVPMGVHLPLEIIFDPLNLVPFGAAFKAFKPAKAMLKYKARGFTVKEAAKMVARAGRIEKAARVEAQRIAEVAREAARKESEELQESLAELLADENNLYMRDDALAASDPAYSGGGFAGAGPGAGHYNEVTIIDDASADAVARGHDKLPTDSLGTAEVDLNANYGLPTGLARGEPLRGDITQVGKIGGEGLTAIINDASLSEEAAWAFKAWFHTGVRPAELEMIEWDDIASMLAGSGSGRKHIILGKGKEGGQGSSRLLDEDAVKFFQEYADYRKTWEQPQYGGLEGALPPGTEKAFRMPDGLTGTDAVTALNKEFKRVAESAAHNPTEGTHMSYGAKLLKFYEGNGNFTYIFRLSKANEAYIKAGKGSKGLLEAMQILGHASPIHTARYISLTHHNRSNFTDLFYAMSDRVSSIDINVARQALNDPAAEWRQQIPPKQLELMGELDLFSTLKKGDKDRKGFQNKWRKIANDHINAERIKLLEKIVDPDQALAMDIPKKIFLDENGVDQYPALARAIASLQSLQHFTQFLTNSISEKRLISRSVDVVERAKNPDKELAAEYTKLMEDSTKAATAMAEWFEPLLELAHSHLTIIDDIFDGAPTSLRTPKNTEQLALLKMPFEVLGWHELQKAELAKQGGRFGGSKKPTLISLPLFRTLLLSSKAELKKSPEAVRKKIQEEAAELPKWEKMNPRQREEMYDLAVGYVVRPSVKGAEAAGTTLKGRGGSNLWVITDWKRSKKGGKITHAVVEKLASTAVDESGLLVRAAVQATREIPLSQFGNWMQQYELPLDVATMRMITQGGSNKLTAKSVAHTLFQWGGNPHSIQTKTTINAGSDSAWSTKRLKDNGHMTRSGGSDAAPTYIFSQEVRDEWTKLMDEAPDEFKWAKLQQEGAGQPPRRDPPRAGSPTPDPGIPEGMDPANKIRFQDEDGEWHDFIKRVTTPRGMVQKMTFAGGEMMYRFFKKMPPDSHKLIRMFVPGTFGASLAARMRWTYVFSRSEGRNVASDIGHMLDEIHDAFKSNRRNGRARADKFLANEADAGIDAKTGKFRNSEILWRDYNRSHGVMAKDIMLGDGVTLPAVVVDEEILSMIRSGVQKGGFISDMPPSVRHAKLGDTLPELRMGPLAVMEETFKYFKKRDPKMWDDTRINRERRKFNHKHSLSDLSTILGTHRDDLHLFYKLNAQQQKMYDWYHQIQPMLLNVLEKAGYDLESASSVLGVKRSEMRHSFVPHLATERMGGIDAPPKMVELGQNPTQWMERQHYWQISGKMQQGQGIGRIKHEVYNTDPILAIQRTAESYYDKIAADRFMDEFAKLGILEEELPLADEIGKKILASRAGEVPFDRHYNKHARKFFGDGWATLSTDLIKKRIDEITEMSVNYKNIQIKNASEYAPLGHDLRRTALPPEASRELMALISDELKDPSKFLTLPSAAANMLRILATGADLGVALLHGFGGLGMTVSPFSGWNSKQRWAWSRATINMGKAMLMPSVRREWYKSTQLTRADMQKYGVAFFRSTHIEDLPLPGLFTKGQLHPNLDKPGMKQISRAGEMAWTIPERMINGFGFFLDVSKTEMWKAQSLKIRKDFGIIDAAGTLTGAGDTAGADRAFNDMAASLNAIHGTLEPATVGIPQKQRSFESAFLLYAALYRRSAVALLKNMTSGVGEGVAKTFTEGPTAGYQAFQARKWRRNMALEAASGMSMAGFAIGMAAYATGNNPDVFDPGSADFMSANFGNMRIGMGTPYYTYIRLGRDVFDQVKEGDASGLGEVNFSDNALLRFARSMTSPTTGIAVDVATGTSFIGDPLRDTSGGWEANKIGSRISRNMWPFWMDTMLLEDEVGAKRGALAEFFGLRVSPQSPFGRMETARNVAIMIDDDPSLVRWKEAQEKAGLEISGYTLPKLLMRELIDRHPDLQALEDEIAEDVQWRGSRLRKDQDMYIQEVKVNREGGIHPKTGVEVKGLVQQLIGIEKRFVEGEISADQMRRMKSDAEKQHMGANKQLAETYDNVIKTFEERRTGSLNNPEDIFLFDLEYDRYRAEVTGADNLYDEYGNFDVNMHVKLEIDFQIQLSQRYGDLAGQIWKYIGALRKEGKFLPGKMAEMEEWQADEGDTYWNLHETLWGPKSRKATMINLWRGRTSAQEKELFERKNPVVKFYLKQLKFHQDKLRRQQPKIDAGLVEFYGYRALTPLGKRVERQRAALALARYPASILTDATYQASPGLAVPETQEWPTDVQPVLVTETDPTQPPLQTAPVMR